MPANIFVATVERIVTVGSTPVVVDADDETLVMTAAGIEDPPKSPGIMLAAVTLVLFFRRLLERLPIDQRA